MNEPLPEPLVPAEINLQDFQFMPLDVLRLRDSDIATIATAEGFKAAVMLWCASWHQLPAASVPNDDRWLARHSGAGARWKKIRDEALRGFVLCSDGRLYHPVVADKAIESWSKKLAGRDRTRHATEARVRRNEDRSGKLFGRDDQRNVNRNVDQEKGREGKLREEKGREGIKPNGHDVLQDAFALPDWVDPGMWARFEESRKKARHPDLTEYGKSLIVKRLERYRAAGDDPNQCLAEACEFGYRAPFPVKNKQQSANRADAAAAVREQAKRELFGKDQK